MLASLFPEFSGRTESEKSQNEEKKKRVPNQVFQVWAYYCDTIKNDEAFASIELPKKISGINAGCIKNLIKEYSLPTIRLMINCVIMDWPAFSDHHRIRTNFPEIKLLTYFRESISFAATSGSGFSTSAHRFSKYSQYFESLKNGG